MLEGILVGEIEIPMKLKNNNQGQGRHWSGSHKERSVATEAVSNARFWVHPMLDIDENVSVSDFLVGAAATEDQKIGLIVWRMLGKGERLWDADSILRGNYKQIQDALIEAGLAPDDSPKYIDWVLGRQEDRLRDLGSRVLIEVYYL